MKIYAQTLNIPFKKRYGSNAPSCSPPRPLHAVDLRPWSQNIHYSQQGRCEHWSVCDLDTPVIAELDVFYRVGVEGYKIQNQKVASMVLVVVTAIMVVVARDDS